jgi:hypothetical protein
MTIVPGYGYDMELANQLSTDQGRRQASSGTEKGACIMRARKIKKLEKKASKLEKKARKATKKSDKVVKQAAKATKKADKASAKKAG